MLEVLLLLNILIILIVYNCKVIIANSSKFGLYDIKEDLLTITSEENQLLNEVVDLAKNNEDILNMIVSCKDDLSIKYEYIFSDEINFRFVIENGEMFIKNKVDRTHEIKREIEVKFLEMSDGLEFIFIPKSYKLYYAI